MTADQLANSEWAYQSAARNAEAARAARNLAVRQAIDAGWTHARIADATGLTRSRVGQIATATKTPST